MPATCRRVSAQFSIPSPIRTRSSADVTATLTAEQLAAITAVEVPLAVVQDPNGKNTGTATWTYNIADGAFDFLADGETLTLTYLARVDNNYAPNNETTFVPFTIDDHRHQRQADRRLDRRRNHRADRHRQYGVDTVTGTVTFTDLDLTDRPVVSAAISPPIRSAIIDAEGNDVTGR